MSTQWYVVLGVGVFFGVMALVGLIIEYRNRRDISQRSVEKILKKRDQILLSQAIAENKREREKLLAELQAFAEKQRKNTRATIDKADLEELERIIRGKNAPKNL